MVGNCAYIDPDGKLDVKNVGNQIKWLQGQGFVDKGFRSSDHRQGFCEAGLRGVRAASGMGLTQHRLPGWSRDEPGMTGWNNRPRSTTSMDLIADHITHRFGALEVLDDVSFTVGAGEVVAIVGPSGCGKSTLFSILGGLLQPSAGAAELRGAPPAESLNPLTFVFQDFALLPWCTVEQNVEFPLQHTGLVLPRGARWSTTPCAAPGFPISAARIRNNFRAACASASASPGRWRCGRRSFMDEPLSALDSQTRELLMEDFSGCSPMARWARSM